LFLFPSQQKWETGGHYHTHEERALEPRVFGSARSVSSQRSQGRLLQACRSAAVEKAFPVSTPSPCWATAACLPRCVRPRFSQKPGTQTRRWEKGRERLPQLGCWRGCGGSRGAAALPPALLPAAQPAPLRSVAGRSLSAARCRALLEAAQALKAAADSPGLVESSFPRPSCGAPKRLGQAQGGSRAASGS